MKISENAVLHEFIIFEYMDFRKQKNDIWKCIFVLLVYSELYIHVLSVSTRFNVILCIYEHILNDVLSFCIFVFFKSENVRVRKLMFLSYF